MRLAIATLVFALALTACASLGLQTQPQQIAAGCATASASIKVITAANDLGKLDQAQHRAVADAIILVSPICGADQAPTLDDVKREAFAAAIAALQAAATKVAPQ